MLTTFERDADVLSLGVCQFLTAVASSVSHGPQSIPGVFVVLHPRMLATSAQQNFKHDHVNPLSSAVGSNKVTRLALLFVGL